MNINKFIESHEDLKISEVVKVKIPVVYFLCKNPSKKIIYIGSTVDLYGRVSSHIKRPEFKDCLIYYFPSPIEKYQAKEQLLIKEIQPEFNTMYANKKKVSVKTKGIILNTEKISLELRRLGKNKTWLAKQLDVYPSWITYIFKEKPITQAEKIGKALGIEPRDLIK